MSKALNASCESGSVTVEGQEIPATILSEGVGSSTGIVILDKDKVYYIPNRASDLKDTLTSVVSALQQIATTLTSIGAGMTGPTTAPPPTLATDVAQINTLASQLDTLKGQLK